MPEIAIQVENLGKRYRIGQRERYYALRDIIARLPRRAAAWVGGRLGRRVTGQNLDYVWALKDVSFEVERGEVVGIIGRNGAGKTTLLKILSRITEPTEGCARLNGRVGSLLEVGTGFHPELTGRENIYLSGAILGMRRSEIARKFDEIVSFAQVEKFIDTPVKHYSSGMYMRLAFAVAAHLEPEILLVDEVLAVGDLEFQKKCLGKMEEVSRGGSRTVLFVSHQMNQIRRLCQRVIWLDGGRIVRSGPTHEVVSAYEAALTSGEWLRQERPDAPRVKARFLRWEIVEPRNDQPNILTSLGPVSVKFLLQVNESIRVTDHGLALFNTDGLMIWATAIYNLAIERGLWSLVYHFPLLPLKPGPYRWRVTLYDDWGLIDLWDCVPEMIVATPPLGSKSDAWSGLINLPWQLHVQEVNHT